MASATPSTRPTPQQLAAQNDYARRAILALGVPMTFSIYSQTIPTPNAGQVINIVPKNVGLLKRFIVEITGTVTAGAGETLTRTKLGLANILSNVQFNDLSNQVRINTTGWHLNMIATARRGAAYGAAFASDTPCGFGSNYPVMDAPASVNAGAPQTFRAMFEIPICYSDTDFRGGIYLAVVSANAGLQLQINPNFLGASGVDETLYGYKSDSANPVSTLTGMTVQVYQEIIDQIPPQQNGQPILPVQDLTQAYLLNNTAFSGLNVGQDLGMPYANFRQFLSTCLIYDNQGLNPGTDITSFAMQIANYTNLIKYDPFINQLKTRNMIGDDFPIGAYYFDHRMKPIDTIQFGNQQLIITPSNVAGVNTQVLLGYEAIAIINQLIQAGSLANS